jgi:HK97 family phage portal protein
MGIDSGTNSGIREITGQQGDFAIARTSEPYLWRALDVRAKAISQVPLRVCIRDGAAGRKEWTTHPSLDILKRTNPLGYVAGLSTLMRYTLQSLDIYGRAAWKMAYDRKGRPSEVYWMTPANYTPLHGYDRGNNNIPFWGLRLGTGNSAQDIKAQELVYFTTDNPSDPILGTSKVAVLQNPINLRAYSQRSNMDFFRNSMRPDWMLHGQFRNTEENVERIRRAIRRHLSGESNRMPLILGENMTATLLTTNHNDAEWIGQQRLAQEEISSVFGVPVIYLNNLERATYDNISAAKLILWHDTMIAEGDMLTEAITRNYLWRFWPETIGQNLEYAFDYAAIEGLGEDIAKIWERTR